MPEPIPDWQPPLREEFIEQHRSNVLIRYFGDVFDWHGYVKFLSLAALRETSRDVPLEKLFVEPHIATQHLSPDAFDSNQAQPATKALSAALAEYPRLVLLGDPGSGKSTVVNWICTALGRGMDGPLAKDLGGPLVPLPMILRELGIGREFAGVGNVTERWNLLLEMFLVRPVATQLRAERHTPHGKNLADSLVVKLLESGQAIVLLDGIDEIGSVEVRKALREAVHEGMRRHPRARWVLTSRIVGYEEVMFDVIPIPGRRHIASLPDQGEIGEIPSNVLTWQREPTVRLKRVIPLLHLAPFNDGQIDQFTRLWWAHHESNPHLAGTKPKQFIDALRQSHGACSLARLPHLLTMIALIYRVQAELPDGRALLYKFITDAYLGTLDKERGLVHLRPIPANVEEMSRWLARVGWELQRRRSAAPGKDGAGREVLIEREELLDLLVEVIQPKGGFSAAETAQLFLEYAGRRSGLLLPRGEGLYAFLHLSFQEYFASLHLRDQVSDPEWWLGESAGAPSTRLADLRGYADQSFWRETLVFLWENAALINPKLPERLLVRLLGWKRDSSQWAEFPLPKEAEMKTVKEFKLPERLILVAALSVNPHVTLEPAAVRRALWERCARWQVRISAQIAKASAYFSDENLVARQLLSRPASATEILHHLVRVLNEEELGRLDLHSCTALSDLSPLKGLPSLQWLDLSDCTALSDLSSLKGLPSLQWLGLGRCTALSDLSPLKGLPSLQSFDLTGCTALSDLSPLQSLPSLQWLGLRDCTALSDLSSLKGLPSLQWLGLRGCIALSDLSPLKGLPSLHSLDLTGCTALSDLSPLQGLRSLQLLDLTGCTALSDLSPLQGLPSLQSLNLTGCTALSDLSPLQGLLNLHWLYLSGCTALSDPKIEKLRRARPKTRILK